MGDTPMPENFLQLCEIADAVGLKGDYKPLLAAFNAARGRILKCGNNAAWRLMAHHNRPEHLSAEYQAQLLEDANFMHHMVKAVNVNAWIETLGGALYTSEPNTIQSIFDNAWEAINGRGDYEEHFDGKTPMRRWLKDSFANATNPLTQDIKRKLDESATLEPESP